MELIFQLLLGLVAMFVQNVAAATFESHCHPTDWNLTSARTPHSSFYILTVKCLGTDGNFLPPESHNLNHCVANQNGLAVPWLNGDFSKSCDGCQKVDVPGSAFPKQMRCHCRDLSGQTVEHTVFPGHFFNVTDGILTCPISDKITPPKNPFPPKSSPPPATRSGLTHPGPPVAIVSRSDKNQTQGYHNFMDFCDTFDVKAGSANGTFELWAMCYNLARYPDFSNLDLSWCFSVCRDNGRGLVAKANGDKNDLSKIGDKCHSCVRNDAVGRAGMTCTCEENHVRFQATIDLNQYIGTWNGKLTCAGRMNWPDAEFPDRLQPAPQPTKVARDDKDDDPPKRGVMSGFLKYCNNNWTYSEENGHVLTTQCNYNPLRKSGQTSLDLGQCLVYEDDKIVPQVNPLRSLKFDCWQCGSTRGGTNTGGPVMWCYCKDFFNIIDKDAKWDEINLDDFIGVTERNAIQCMGQSGTIPPEEKIKKARRAVAKARIEGGH